MAVRRVSGFLSDSLPGVDGLELTPLYPASLDASAIRDRLAEHGLEAAAIGTVLMGIVAQMTLLKATTRSLPRPRSVCAT